MSVVEIAKKHISDVDDDLFAFDSLNTSVQDKRLDVMKKLNEYMNKMPDHLPDKQGEAIAQFMPMQMYMSLLNDMENSSLKRVNLKFRKKDQDTDEKTAAEISAFLKLPESERIMKNVDMDKMSEDLNNLVESNTPISERELIINEPNHLKE